MNRNLIGMYKTTDHPLNNTGKAQAEKLAEAIEQVWGSKKEMNEELCKI